MNRFVFALPLLILIFLFGMVFKTAMTPHEIKLVHKQAPDYAIENFIEGEAPFTTSDLQGTITMVSFFATWCPPCLAEHRQLMSLANDHKLRIIGIAHKDERPSLKQFLSDKGNPFAKIAFDPNGESYFLWGVSGIPESFLVDERGYVRYRHQGMITPSDIENRILPAIKAIRESKE